MTLADLTESLRETLAVFDATEAGVPMTTNEVADVLDLGRRSTYERLDRLAERDRIETKKVGASGRVWWRSGASTDDESGESTADGSAARSDGGAEQFESLVDAVEEYAIFLLDAEGRITTWNEGARRIKGYDAAEAIGEDIRLFYTPADRRAAVPERNLADAAAGGSVEDEGWRVRADGSRFWANVTITALRGDDGELRGYTKVTRDMTERREHEQELRRERDLLEQVLEASPSLVGVFDAESHTLLRANEALVDFFGAVRDAVSGEHEYVVGDVPVYDPDGAPVPRDERPYARVIETGEPVYDWRCQMERSDGVRRWFSINSMPIVEDGRVEQVVVVGDDVTRLEEQARRLERQRDDLESELDEVFGRVADAFFGLDGDRRFTYVNERAGELLGHGAADLVGERLDAFAGIGDVVPRERYERAMAAQEVVSFEVYYPPRTTWFEVRIYPSETGLSVYFRDVTERKERERELERYATIVETITDGVYALDDEERFVLVNQAFCEMTGYSREELLGEHPTLINSRAVNDAANELETEVLAGGRDRAVLEFDIETADGDAVPVESHWSVYQYDDAHGRCGVARDVSERLTRERELEAQREHLAVLDYLNGVVHEITDAVIDQSTREEIERTVCEALAASEPYAFAWIGEVDPGAGTIRLRTEAGVEGYLDDLTVPVDPADPAGNGPTATAIRTGEMQVVSDVRADYDVAEWCEHADRYGFRSSAAIPIVYEGVRYGVLNVYSPRTGAFADEERAVVGRLGEIVGHAIAAVERKRALTSDQVHEIDFRIPDVFSALDIPASAADRITLDQVVPIGDGEHLVYGTATDEDMAVVDAIVETLPTWESVRVVDTGFGRTKFELLLSESSILNSVASRHGYVVGAWIEDDDYHMTVQLPHGVDIRPFTDAVLEAYPAAELRAQRQVMRGDDGANRMVSALEVELTARQRTALETAHFAGYFEWPRESTGGDLARALDISAPTFSQHLRTAERKVFEALFDSLAPTG